MSREKLFIVSIKHGIARQEKVTNNLTKTYTPMRFYTWNDMSQILGGVGENEAQRVRGFGLVNVDRAV